MLEMHLNKTERPAQKARNERYSKDLGPVLESIDREIAFYRKRAGEVFFVGLLVEVLILTGRERISLPENWLVTPAIHSVLFIVVAAVGIALGHEYRERIRMLKLKRADVLEPAFDRVYPSKQDQSLSEIQVLYVVLVFLSSGGIFVVWLKALSTRANFSTAFWPVFTVFMTISVVAMGILLVGYVTPWLRTVLRKRRQHRSHGR